MADDLLTYEATQEYLAALVPPREKELQAMEEFAEKSDFPIIGPACGYYCYQLARMIKARSVFELGSGYGYSTAWFAKAVRRLALSRVEATGEGGASHRLGGGTV
jgi:predicted O-methyltransferase YrrM